MKKVFLSAGFFLAFIMLSYTLDEKESLPEWFLPLREAVYEQVLGAEEVYQVYEGVLAKTNELSGAGRFSLSSHCEYLMGRAYQYFKNEKKAIEHYQKGYDEALQSLKIKESAEGRTYLAENLSQLCTLKNTIWVMAHGLDVEKFSKQALNLDPRAVKAQYMIASRWIYAPSPFSDIPKGLQMMKDILNGDYHIEKDDLFNLYVSLAYGNIKEKQKELARQWIDKALSVYPGNQFAGVELLSDLVQ
ncbi:MAG: hypothetical protein LBV68_08500 [Spirochaetaceae bacterium]|jgi:tetratricopeptide (TPR) repeat protein|nr:hypothetical protein [Spirochaetaceae bacterium]